MLLPDTPAFCAVFLTLPLLLRRFGQADLIVNIGLDQPAVLPPFLKDRRGQLRGKSLPFQYASGFRQPGPCAGITNHRHIAETEKPRFSRAESNILPVATTMRSRFAASAATSFV